jgi:hypothetical protein
MTISIVPSGWLEGLDVNGILRGQGADAASVRRRNPRLVAVAERAAREGIDLLDPRVAYRRLAVRSVQPGRVLLEDGGELTGPLVAAGLSCATEVAVAVATIGERVETRVCRMFGRDLPYALALDGLGSAAVEALVSAARQHFRQLRGDHGAGVTIALCPGMEGWPLAAGQAEIFALLGIEPAGVRVSAAGQMLPRKSLSMVVGLGPHARQDGRTCDHCGLRASCRHQEDRGSG